MKFTSILLFVAAMQISATGLSQDTRLKLAFNEATLSELIEAIEAQSEFRVFYKTDQVNILETISVSEQDGTVASLLSDALTGSNLSYRIMDKVIVLTNLTYEKQQQQTVRGTITDGTTGEPLAGVTVQVQGTMTGAISQADGSFSVNIPQGAEALIFSFVGFETQEINIAGRTVIDVVMTQEITALEEVVVVGYGTQAKKDITGSVAVVKAEDLLATPSASFTGQLQGRAAGIMIGTSGAPGSEATVRIRGVGSVNDNSPLFIIDGISTRNQDMSTINPNDIESIQILKDASSASIYGAQAANGVVIITTKKGTTSGQPRITYDGYYGIQNLAKGFELLNAEEWMEAEYQMQSNAFSLRGLSGTPTHPQFGTGTFTLPDYLIPTAASEGDPNTTLDDYDEITNRITKTAKEGTDWFDEITRTAPIQSHQLSLLGGSDKGTYALSLNYFDQDGTVIYSYFKRYSVRANSQFNIRPGIRIGENLSVSYSTYNIRNSEADTYDGVIGAALQTVPYLPVFDIAGNYAGNLAQGSGAGANAYAGIENQKDYENKGYRLLGNIFAEIDFFKYLTFKTNFGLDYNNMYNLRMVKEQFYQHNSSPTTLTETFRQNNRWVFSNTLNFDHTFGAHKVTALLGMEAIRDGIGRTLRGSRQNFEFEDDVNTWILDFGDATTATNSGSFNGEVSFFSLFGRVDYVLSDKYMVTGTIRRDGSSKFSEANRHGVFPAISLGWRMSEENFLNDIAWITNLKWRVGYGTTGNSEIPSKYNWANQYAVSLTQSSYDFNNTQIGSTGYRLSAYGNLDTKWETTKMLNIGLDASFFRQAIEITADYFIKNTSDMLTAAAYTALAGDAAAPYVNIGDMRNKGIEINITHRGGIAGDWNYEVTGNFSAYKNEVLKLSVNENYALYSQVTGLGNISITTKGQPVGMFYGWNVLGFYDSEDEVLNYKTQGGETVLPYGVASLAALQPGEWVGKFIFEDVDGNGVIDGNDQTIIGNPHPDFTASLNLAVAYKNFDLSVYGYSSVGNEIFRQWKQSTDYAAQVLGRSKDFLYDSWTPEHHDASIPILDSQDPVTGKGSHSAYIENGSFLKIKNLTLGYTFPQTGILNTLRINNLRVYLQGSNLVTLTKYKGLDPEIGNKTTGASGDLERGIDGGYWPAPRQFIVGVTLGF
ncbi:MAG: TonB-dependent receptor [Bacteroidales bacterium]|nr:TonB-dependent receptor [Bacteroidales bacterium]